MVNPEHQFHVVDYCIFGATIIVSLGIGVYQAMSGGKQRTTSEYFVGNRAMSIMPVAISLLVSFESSIMMLGVPAEVYVYGIQVVFAGIGYVIAYIVSLILIVPLVHPLKITSAYEYLEMRFESHATRILGTVLGMWVYVCYMGIVLFGPAIALEAVTGFPQWTSIVSIALASVIYTSIGGLKAVIWTDVFQFTIMFAGFFAVLIKGTMEIGGIEKTWEVAAANGRVNLFNFDPDPTVRHTFWNLFFGSMLRGFGLIFNQSSIQRISATPTISTAKRVLLITSPGFLICTILASIEGIIAYAYYDVRGCDPLKSGQISNPNQVVPYMVMDIFQGMQGMPGLFMASLFSASLSTLSSGLSSLSALFWTDLLKPHVKPMSEFKATVISKISVVVFGILAVIVAFLIAQVGGPLTQITGSLLSAIGGPLSGLFMFGAFCPWGNAKGGFWGTILSTIVTFIICLGQMTTDGAVKNTKLPPAPVDSCPSELALINATIMTSNMTSVGAEYAMNATSVSNMASVVISSNMTSFVTSAAGEIGGSLGMYESSTFAEQITESVAEPTGFSRVFMVSYMLFAAIGIIQVLLYGTIISFCTGYKKPGEVHRRFLAPFFDTLFPFLPECILRPLRVGYTFHYNSTNSVGERFSISEYEKVDTVRDMFDQEVEMQKQNNQTKEDIDPVYAVVKRSDGDANNIAKENEVKRNSVEVNGNGAVRVNGKREREQSRDVDVTDGVGGVNGNRNEAITESNEQAELGRSGKVLKAASEGDLGFSTVHMGGREMNILRADSKSSSKGFIVTEYNENSSAVHVRSQSVDFDVPPSENETGEV